MAASSASRKRERELDASSLPDDSISPSDTSLQAANSHASTTNFRNVSACDRCRNRKNRCDQKLPRCSNCERARVKCVGFDPVSKRKIPRSYVYYLETRVQNLESLLAERGISVPLPDDDFAISETIKPGVNVPFPIVDENEDSAQESKAVRLPTRTTIDPLLKERDDGEKLNKMANAMGVSVRGTPDPRYQPSARGVSFNRIVMEAVTTSAHPPLNALGTAGSKNSKPSAIDAAGGSASTSRDTFFGLYSKPSVKGAPFPDEQLGRRLVDLYFEHANPQIPVLHRNEFHSLFRRVYDKDEKKRTPRELYLMNIVFAIGSGIIMDTSTFDSTAVATESPSDSQEARSKKRLRLASQQHQPEEYHASAIVHVKSFLSSPPTSEGVSGGLEELQAMLLLAGLALLRPVAPGLWYIIGQAVRLSIDLGLHFEEIDSDLDFRVASDLPNERRPANFGQKQWTRDLRRRLWWCVFNMDRLVSSCVGRPISISESVVTTEFPSMLDDKYIRRTGFIKSPDTEEAPSYKFVSRHYLHLRLLQSEIMQVLQQQHADQTRALGGVHSNRYELRSPFLQNFASFRDWRTDVDRRLEEWKMSAPKQQVTNVAFNPLFLELNYWQAIIMLYKQSLSVPEPLASELSVETGEEVQSPGARLQMESEEDKQMVFDKVAVAGHMVLKIYRTLHRDKLVNYTFLATHHLFMSGISFLYAIWHSPFVRSRLTEEEVDLTVLAGASVLNDLSEKCPPAAACRRAFERMSRATIAEVMRSTGFGTSTTLGPQPFNSLGGYFGRASRPAEEHAPASPTQGRRQIPKFDYNLKGLFSEEEIASHQTTHGHLEHSVTRSSDASEPFPRNLPAQDAGTGSAAMFQQARLHDALDADISNPGSSYRAPPQQQAFAQPFAEEEEETLTPPAQPGFAAIDSLDFSYDSAAFSDADPDAPLWVGDHASAGGGMDSALGSIGLDATWDFTNEDIFMHPFFFGGENANGY